MVQHYQPQIRVQLAGHLHYPFGVFDLPRFHQFHRQRDSQRREIGKPLDGELVDRRSGGGSLAFAHHFGEGGGMSLVDVLGSSPHCLHSGQHV